ncbi:MAG: hypothetical protein NVS1B4_15670 [Gemmatimonadaceae bacterium]
MFEYRSGQITPVSCLAKFVSGANNRRDVCGDPLDIQCWKGLTVDQQTVASKDDGRLNTVPLADSCDEVANG